MPRPASLLAALFLSLLAAGGAVLTAAPALAAQLLVGDLPDVRLRLWLKAAQEIRNERLIIKDEPVRLKERARLYIPAKGRA